MRFTKEQYEKAIANLHLGLDQLAPDSRCCAICGDSGHCAWECGRNPLLAMAICEGIAQSSDDLHEKLHYLAGYVTHMGHQQGPASVHLPAVDIRNLLAAAKRVCAAQRADNAPSGSPIADLRDEIARLA